jgi:hypothetical protein
MIKINVRTVNSPKVVGVITYDKGKVSFSNKAARDVFTSAKNKAVPVRPPLSVAKTVEVLKSWSNGYVMTEVQTP